MKRILLVARCILFAFILHSCTSDDGIGSATVVTFPTSGLLGQELIIELDHVPMGNLQVFFDNEEAPIDYFSEDAIKVIVPRTLTSATPLLKVIDINTNTTILSETFALKKPVIASYSASTVTFGEVFTIYGENFDVSQGYVKVYVNNQLATIVTTAYDQIEVMLPTAITSPNLEVKVNAQLQDVVSVLPLQLKPPKIIAITNTTAWITAQLVVTGENFNPNYEFGEVFVNGTKCYFTASGNSLSIDTPPGPYSDFKITNITYTTGELSSSFDCNLPVGNDVVMVNHFDDIRLHHQIFVHNDKAYTFKTIDDGDFTGSGDYTLLEFSPTTEQWTELSSFQYSGSIADAVYDGNDTVYLYKYHPDSNSYSLSKLNMNTFSETALTLPDTHIWTPILFAYQENLYLLSGLNNNGGAVTARAEKYKYSEATNTWTTLPSSAFADLPLVSAQGGYGKCNYLHHGGNIYISYHYLNTFKISPNLSVESFMYSFYFGYQNGVFGKPLNSNTGLANISNGAQIDFDHHGNYFTVNNQPYCISGSYSMYFQNSSFTQKVRKEILNGLL